MIAHQLAVLRSIDKKIALQRARKSTVNVQRCVDKLYNALETNTPYRTDFFAKCKAIEDEFRELETDSDDDSEEEV